MFNNIILLTTCLLLFVVNSAPAELNALSRPIELVNEESHTYLEMTTKRAIETRRISEVDRLSTERGTQFEEELAREIALHAPDYTVDDSHQSNINYFIESNFGINPTNIYCVAPDRIKTREFVFVDEENGIVVKVFPQIPQHYFKIIHELSGHEAFKELNIQQLNVVNFEALGKYTFDGSEYLLLGMSFAKGKEIREYLDEIYYAENPVEKLAAIEQAKRILRKLGEVIGEVHLKAAVKVTVTDEHKNAVVNHYHQAIDQAIEKYKSEEGGNSEDLIKYFNQILAQYELENVYFSIFHGDAHLANFLYDNGSDQLTIIDSVKAHLSIDPESCPISDNYVHDCVKIEEAIIKQILLHESNDLLIQELFEAFHHGYDERAAAIVNPSSLNLDRSYNFLNRLVSSLKWKNEKDQAEREYRLRTYDYYKKYFCMED